MWPRAFASSCSPGDLGTWVALATAQQGDGRSRPPRSCLHAFFLCPRQRGRRLTSRQGVPLAEQDPECSPPSENYILTISARDQVSTLAWTLRGFRRRSRAAPAPEAILRSVALGADRSGEKHLGARVSAFISKVPAAGSEHGFWSPAGLDLNSRLLS